MQCPGCQDEHREGHRCCAECGASWAPSCPCCGFSTEQGEQFCSSRGVYSAAAHRMPESTARSSRLNTPRHLVATISTSEGSLLGKRTQVTMQYTTLMHMTCGLPQAEVDLAKTAVRLKVCQHPPASGEREQKRPHPQTMDDLEHRRTIRYDALEEKVVSRHAGGRGSSVSGVDGSVGLPAWAVLCSGDRGSAHRLAHLAEPGRVGAAEL